MEPNPALLSHLDADARPRMVDVGGKTATDRVAHAQARVRFPPEVATQLREATGSATALPAPSSRRWTGMNWASAKAGRTVARDTCSGAAGAAPMPASSAGRT